MSAPATDATRALNGATWRHGYRNPDNTRHDPGIVHQRSPIAVTMAGRYAPFVVAAHALGHARHDVRAVFFAWRHGRPVGALIWCWCGTKLLTGVLTHDPDAGRYACRLCEIRVPRTVAVHTTVTVEIGGRA